MLNFVHMSLSWIIWIIIRHDNVLTLQYELFWWHQLSRAWEPENRCSLSFCWLSVHDQQHLSPAAYTPLETSLVNYFPKQTKSGSSVNSLKSSEAEMSSATSNIWWHWCRNIGQLQLNCILKAFSKETVMPKRQQRRHIDIQLVIFTTIVYIYRDVYFECLNIAAGSQIWLMI